MFNTNTVTWYMMSSDIPKTSHYLMIGINTHEVMMWKWKEIILKWTHNCINISLYIYYNTKLLLKKQQRKLCMWVESLTGDIVDILPGDVVCYQPTHGETNNGACIGPWNRQDSS